MNRVLDRRGLLTLACVAIAAPAAALQTTEAPEEVDALWRARCESADLHAQVLRQVREQLSDPARRARAEEILASMRCPVCGCSLSDD